MLRAALLVMGAVASSCHHADPRYHRSSDGKTEVFYVSSNRAIFRHVLVDPDHKTRIRFDLDEAKPGESPSDPSVTGDAVVKVLVEDIERGGWVKLDSGKGLLLVGLAPIETPPQSFDEIVQATAGRQHVFFLVSATELFVSKTLDELASQLPHSSAALRSATLKDASDFFEVLKKSPRSESLD